MLVRNARIILPDRIAESACVLIEGDRITRIFERGSEPSLKNNGVIDLSGLTLFPGFIDLHIHGAVGVDTMAAGSADLLRTADFLARHGVTSWLPTLVPAAVEQYQTAIQAITECLDHQRANGGGAQVYGVHYEGPFVNSEQCGALHREHFRSFESKKDLDQLPTIKTARALHMMTLAPEVKGGIDLIKELNQRGWITSIGHTRATVDVLDEARAAGARHMTHFMNAMTPLHHRAPGPVGWGLINDEVTCDVIADGLHVDPSVLKLIIRTKGCERVSLISDAIAATGEGDGEYRIWGETITVKDGRTQNARGNIAGSVITVLDAVRLLLSLKVPESDVAQMASTNPAQVLGIDGDRGTIEVGKRADLVALDEKLNVHTTIVGGRVIDY